MIRILESAGDVVLYKFLIILTKSLSLVDSWERYYDSTIGGYLIDWKYRYNKYTKKTDSRDVTHSDIIDSLPGDLRRLWRTSDDIAWGKTDYYRDDIRFFISNDDLLSSSQVDYLKSKYMNVSEATNASSIGGGHVGSIDIIGTAPITDYEFNLELDKCGD